LEKNGRQGQRWARLEEGRNRTGRAAKDRAEGTRKKMVDRAEGGPGLKKAGREREGLHWTGQRGPGEESWPGQRVGRGLRG